MVIRSPAWSPARSAGWPPETAPTTAACQGWIAPTRAARAAASERETSTRIGSLRPATAIVIREPGADSSAFCTSPQVATESPSIRAIRSPGCSDATAAAPIGSFPLSTLPTVTVGSYGTPYARASAV